MKQTLTRRMLITSSAFGLLTASVPGVLFARSGKMMPANDKRSYRYPSLDDELVSEVVGASHFNLDRVKELVDKRPELARACWDWAFGDFETAIGAASHTGRRDIVEYLISKGARPDIFTYAMMGAYDAVKSMIEARPGVQSVAGPHGITLLQHANVGLRSKDISEAQKAQNEKLIAYLEGLGNADLRQTNLELTEAQQQKYLGDYMYGEGPEDGFSVKLNMRKLLALGKLGKFGGGLYRKGDQIFEYNGITSIDVSFQLEGDWVVSLTIQEPDLTLLAKKVS